MAFSPSPTLMLDTTKLDRETAKTVSSMKNTGQDPNANTGGSGTFTTTSLPQIIDHPGSDLIDPNLGGGNQGAPPPASLSDERRFKRIGFPEPQLPVQRSNPPMPAPMPARQRAVSILNAAPQRVGRLFGAKRKNGYFSYLPNYNQKA